MYDHHEHRHRGGGGGMAGAIPLPPRSPRRSRDLSQDAALHGNGTSPITSHSGNERRISPLNPAYGDGNEAMNHSTNPYTHGQGIYAGGSNPYPQHHSQSQSQYKSYNADSYQTHRGGNPFSDPSPPRHMGFAGGHHGSGGGGGVGGHTQTQAGDEWPLRAINESGYRKPLPSNGRVRRNSWSRGDDI
ncbi:hypothetical protein BCR34DRAFT_560407 [Clohesyomyces aquaticus]|uniref:Uncharacterized protein n=1 Tax=Clohesyomyces aquaticus TaxID=1231657 RepID=A0A1Y1ZXD7_9PLEO|nr:hypothetical protein BCR34DRAFT_560407 [Clohesyomyces aquaticus]